MTSMLKLDRFIYLSTEDLAVDSNGLARTPSHFFPGAKLHTLSEMLELNGGILVAEGGMGKSTLLTCLHADDALGGEAVKIHIHLASLRLVRIVSPNARAPTPPTTSPR